MKKLLINITFATIGALVLSSCERELDQSAFNQILAENVLNKEADFQQAIDGAYSAIKGTGYYSVDTGNQLIVPDLMTDNLIYNAQGRGTNFNAYNWNLTGVNGSVVNLFTQGYFVISRANFALSYLDRLPNGSGKTNIEAQARAIRAMVHFDLAKAYCKIPTQSTDAGTSLGLAYVDTFNPGNPDLTRSLTVNQLYARIIEDLNFAEQNLTNTSTDKGRLTKTAVQGLLSRVYLYMGDYKNAIKFGNLAISSSPSVGSLTSFVNIWASDDTDGVLFKVLNSTQENITTGVAFQQGATSTGGNIKSEYVVPKSFLDLYQSNDVRKSAYFRTSAYQNLMRNHVIKYAFRLNPSTAPLNVVEIKYLRTAEVYLNVAEAAYRDNDPILANKLLNDLKSNRYSGYVPVTLSGNALLNEILLQRRLELAFENDRFYTFKRLGLKLQRTGEGPNVDGTGVPSDVQSIEASDYRWQWPIPQAAINLNPKLQQNPNY